VGGCVHLLQRSTQLTHRVRVPSAVRSRGCELAAGGAGQHQLQLERVVLVAQRRLARAPGSIRAGRSGWGVGWGAALAAAHVGRARTRPGVRRRGDGGDCGYSRAGERDASGGDRDHDHAGGGGGEAAEGGAQS
jgi:hypothetical protein